MTRFRHAAGHELSDRALDVPWFRFEREGLAGILGRSSCRLLVAEEDGTPVAILVVMLHDLDSAERSRATIFVLSIDPSRRATGVGACIVRYAEGIARLNGCRRMEVPADLAAEWGEESWPGFAYDLDETGLCKWLEASDRRRCA